MDFKSQLLSELSRRNIDYIIHVVDDRQDYFHIIVDLVLYEKDPVPPRAAWVMEGASLRYPRLIEPYLNILIENLPAYTHPGTRRNVLKILSRMQIPENHHAFLADLCFRWMTDPERTVAVKVYCMQILANLTGIYPDLKYELREVIIDQLPKNSAGFKSRGNKILAQLKKIPEF